MPGPHLLAFLHIVRPALLRNTKSSATTLLRHVRPGQRGEKQLPIRVVVKARLPPIAAVLHVANGSRVLDSELARQAADSPPTRRTVNLWD